MQETARRPPCVPWKSLQTQTGDLAGLGRDKMVCFDLHNPRLSSPSARAGRGSQIPIFCLHFDLGECLSVWLELATPGVVPP